MFCLFFLLFFRIQIHPYALSNRFEAEFYYMDNSIFICVCFQLFNVSLYYINSVSPHALTCDSVRNSISLIDKHVLTRSVTGKGRFQLILKIKLELNKITKMKSPLSKLI